jgi:type IV pilus assembly protein PilE
MDRSSLRFYSTSARGERGFTLIELLITVAIVAILSAVAYPSYAAYIQRSRIADATSNLAATRVRLEQYYQDQRNYGSTASVCGVAMPTSTDFTLSCNWGTGGTSQTFTLTASGNAGSTMDGFTYTVNESNLQRTTAFPGASGLPANCWLRRKGESC